MNEATNPLHPTSGPVCLSFPANTPSFCHQFADMLPVGPFIMLSSYALIVPVLSIFGAVDILQWQVLLGKIKETKVVFGSYSPPSLLSDTM